MNEAINVTGSENIAKACGKYGATLVYISTDYVFDGNKPVGQEWVETDRPDPKTEYGRTKRLGELAVERYAEHFILSVLLGYLEIMVKLCLYHGAVSGKSLPFDCCQ